MAAPSRICIRFDGTIDDTFLWKSSNQEVFRVPVHSVRLPPKGSGHWDLSRFLLGVLSMRVGYAQFLKDTSNPSHGM